MYLRIIAVTAMIVLVCVWGCAGTGAQKQLLEQNFQTMNDEQLLDYYFALDEEIDRCEHAGNTGSVGWCTRIGGFGIGVTKGLTGCNPRMLLERRQEVREELRKRKVIP